MKATEEKGGQDGLVFSMLIGTFPRVKGRGGGKDARSPAGGAWEMWRLNYARKQPGGRWS